MPGLTWPITVRLPVQAREVLEAIAARTEMTIGAIAAGFLVMVARLYQDDRNLLNELFKKYGPDAP